MTVGLDQDNQLRIEAALATWGRVCGEPWVLGKSDCCTAVADTWAAISDLDIMEGARTYSNTKELLELLAETKCNDLFELMEHLSLKVGLVEVVDEPLSFDLAFLLWPDQEQNGSKKLNGLPAFFFRGFWHARTHGGYLGVRQGDDRIVGRWGVRYPHSPQQDLQEVA